MAPVASAPTSPAPLIHGTPTRGVATYDAARKLIVLVTPGPTQQATLLQTWTWDGSVWTRRNPALSPPARSASLLAYDPSRRVALLQGGLSRENLTDTWEWDGVTWSQRKPVHSPAASQQPGSMVYDPISQRMLMYQFQQQTWGWDGTDWVQLHPAHVPTLLMGNLVFDGTRVILIGGSGDGGRTEVWGWSGSDWGLLASGRTPEQPPIVPTVFDVAHHQVLLHGGGPGDDTWTWNGSKWLREHPKHSPISPWPPQLVYDDALGDVVAIASTDRGPITGLYAWTGRDWIAIGTGTAPAAEAGNGMVPAVAAEARVRSAVTNTHPVLLPRWPAGVGQALVTADATSFSLHAMNEDRTIQITIGTIVPGNSALGAAAGSISFRHDVAFHQYLAGDPTGWRDIWWMERPGQSTSDFGLKDRSGIPYVLSTTGLTEAEFFALAGSLH